MKKYTVLLVLLAGCEGCVGLPKTKIPDTRPLSEMMMTYDVRMYIGQMYATAMSENREHAACLWGDYELSDVKLTYKSRSYYRVRFDSISPAFGTGATSNTFGIPESGPCPDDAIATIHTHLSDAGPSAQDLLVFLGTSKHVLTMVVSGLALTPDERPLAMMYFVTRHGLTGHWVIPLFEEPP